MARLLYAFGALASSLTLLAGLDGLSAKPSPQAVKPAAPASAMIGADQPVFLGRMVVTAAPLPQEGRR